MALVYQVWTRLMYQAHMEVHSRITSTLATVMNRL